MTLNQAPADRPGRITPVAVTLALVGGHRLLRDAVAKLLAEREGLRVLGSYAGADQFLAEGLQREPAVLLLDCEGGDWAGRQGMVAALSPSQGGSRVAMLCAKVGAELVRCAVEHSVDGIILKSYSTRDVHAAINYVASGHSVMPVGWQGAFASKARAPLGLRPRHSQILALIAEGCGNDEIAQRLELSPNTVKFHVRALYARLGVRNRVEAANWYAQTLSASARS